MSLEKCPASHREIIRDFEQHLRTTCGLTAGSIAQRTWGVSHFLAAKYGDGRPDLMRLRPRDVATYITALPSRWAASTRSNMVASLRSFFRWLSLRGMCDSGLTECVPTVSRMRYSGIPAHISSQQLDALLNAFDLNTAIGLRGYAASLCMARLGLRVGEVAGLTLDDIDWRDGTLRLKTTKGRRERVLPLPHAVGRALVEYLRKGRPKTDERHVFVNHRPSGRKPPHREAIRGDVRHAFSSAGLQTPSKGTRVLRHTAATHMIRSGATIKDIADVLGHSCIDTTCVYAKVDITALAELAAHWPKEVTA